jgi:hypothetical protein
MLESLSIPHYSPQKGSDNMLGADNQQERLRTVGWIVGFVDGEGCFSVTIQKATTSTGWQVFPEFVVTQSGRSLQALHDLKEFFECGKVFINRRNDNHKEQLYRFCVRSIADLRDKIIPFFLENQLRTAKREDFQKFTRVLELIAERKHLNSKGIMEIAIIAQTMNRKKTIQVLRILRDYTPGIFERDEDIVRAAWRHAEVGRNDQPFNES